MTIEHPSTSKKIHDAVEKITAYLEGRIAEAGNSIYGERPDENGNYSDTYYAAKDRKEQLEGFKQIFLSNLKENTDTDSLNEFIQSVCKQIQNFPEESYTKLFAFIEKTFRLKVEEQTEAPTYYHGIVKYWAEKYGVNPKEIEELIPFNKKFEQHDTAARIRKIMGHFGDLPEGDV